MRVTIVEDEQEEGEAQISPREGLDHTLLEDQERESEEDTEDSEEETEKQGEKGKEKEAEEDKNSDTEGPGGDPPDDRGNPPAGGAAASNGATPAPNTNTHTTQPQQQPNNSQDPPDNNNTNTQNNNTNKNTKTNKNKNKHKNTTPNTNNNTRPTRARKPNVTLQDSNLSDLHKKNPSNTMFRGHSLRHEPKTFDEALRGNDKDLWLEAMKSEVASLKETETFELVPRPKNRKVIKGKWVFKIKELPNGTVDRYKARYVAKGYEQIYGIDYSETYAPVANMSSLHHLLAIALLEGAAIHHMDVKTAFLNATIDEEVYIEPPPGFADPECPDFVWKLCKCIYGLKQASRRWNFTIHEFLESQGFDAIFSDGCIYVRYYERGKVIILIYVDDIVIVCTINLMSEVKEMLKRRFNMTDLGEAKYLLGIEIYYQGNTLRIRQKGFIEQLAERFRMADCRPTFTPIQQGVTLEHLKVTPPECAKLKLKELVGALVYVMRGSRPDIAFAIHWISRHLSAYDRSHWKAAKRILKYLITTKDLCLTFTRDSSTHQPITFDSFCDSDWAGNSHDRKSVGGFFIHIAGGVTNWESKKQSVTAISSTEAEYYSASEATREIIHVRQLFAGLGYHQHKPTLLLIDNQSAKKIAEDENFRQRLKHVDVRYHFIRDKIKDKTIRLEYVPTEENLADMLTKALNRPRLEKLRQMAGITDPRT